MVLLRPAVRMEHVGYNYIHHLRDRRKESSATIFTNFLALMGYWSTIWVAIMLEEHLIFYKRMGMVKFNWEIWNDRTKLPFGGAAVIAFLVGWAGAILCMAQVWYIGPAKEVGEYGTDMGNYVGFAWAALVYPPLRWLELKTLKRDEGNIYAS